MTVKFSRSVAEIVRARRSSRSYQPEPITEDAALRATDGRYLVTTPGVCRYLTFRPEPTPDGLEREYFAKSGGCYLEWFRNEWLGSEPVGWFHPRDAALAELGARWLEKKPELERKFSEARVPVRRSP